MGLEHVIEMVYVPTSPPKPDRVTTYVFPMVKDKSSNLDCLPHSCVSSANASICRLCALTPSIVSNWESQLEIVVLSVSAVSKKSCSPLHVPTVEPEMTSPHRTSMNSSSQYGSVVDVVSEPHVNSIRYEPT